MNKSAAILGLAAGGGAAVVPVYMGNQTQAAFAGTQTFQRGDLTITHELGQYHAGYLTSSAKGTVMITARGETITLAAVHDINHAFLPKVASSYRLAADGGEMQKALYAVFQDKPLLTTGARQTSDGIVIAAVMPEAEALLAELSALSEGELGSAEGMTAKLAELEADGFVSRRDGGYRMQVGFTSGNFVVNDTPRPELLMMLAAMLAQQQPQ